MMYAETVLEIWIDVGMGILLVFFAIQGLLKALRLNSRKTDLRMLATVKAEKLKMQHGGSQTEGNGGKVTTETGKEP
jgi:hypothetical protein